jgi:type I protein arginine methyltransferase
MYSINDYGDMILDRGRTEAYAQAIRSRVTPGATVLEIGCGPGILTMFACQAAARKVYAIESDGVIQIAREAAVANGYADRVEFIQALSTEASLPEKVDVVVSEIHGVLPPYRGSIASILDARDRFLKPGGFLIPERETMSVTIVNAPAIHERIVAPWGRSWGVDYEAARKRAVNCWVRRRFASDAMLVEPKVWATLDYAQLGSASARGSAAWTITQASQAHGLGLWFDSVTAPGSGFSNSPSSGEEHIFEQAFFPWPECCRLEPGDEVSVEIRADEVGEDYVWSWSTEIRTRDHRQPVKKKFRQSQFLSYALSRDYLRKCGSTFVPSPNVKAAIDRMILELFHSGTTLEEISRQLAERFPERFPDSRAALSRVRELSQRYSI